MSGHTSAQPIIRFVNTFEPVVPLYRDVFPALADEGMAAVALVSQALYRTGQEDADKRSFACQCTWVPRPLRRSKRWAALCYALGAPLRLLTRRADLNVFLTQPPFFFVLGAWISRLQRRGYIVHMMDVHPELAGQFGLIKAKGLLYRLLYRATSKALRKADRVAVLGRCMRDVMISRGVEPSRIDIIPNWSAAPAGPEARDANVFRKAHDLADKFVVLYSGNMGIPHEFDTIVEVARRLKSHPDVVLLFVGQGVRRREVEQAAETHENIHLLDHQPLSLLGPMLAEADVHYLSLRLGYEGLVVPSKFYGALASGRPILYEGGPGGELAKVVDETGCGEVISPGDADALHSAIVRYHEEPNTATDHGRRGRDAYWESYCGDVVARRYAGIIAEALGERQQS